MQTVLMMLPSPAVVHERLRRQGIAQLDGTWRCVSAVPNAVTRPSDVSDLSLDLA